VSEKLRLAPQSGGKPKKLVVLFHGYGSQGEDLLSLASYWSRLMPETEFLAPNGPDICETYPLGFQWFGLKEFTPFNVRAGLDVAGPRIRDYLLNALSERNLTPADLSVVGFSQGGMLALELMFVLPGLRGSICYSGAFYPPLAKVLQQPYPEVLLVHGNVDPTVPYIAFMQAQQDLKKFGINPHTLTCTGLGHTIPEEGLKVGGDFLVDIFNQGQPVIYMKQE